MSRKEILSNIDGKLETVQSLLNELKQQELIKDQQAAEAIKLQQTLTSTNQEENNIITVITEEDLEKLRLENKRLRARCELLESGNDSDVTRRIDDAVDQAHQIESLNQRIAEFKQREKKIIETLGKKVLDLRKRLNRLTGYTVYASKDLIYKVKIDNVEGKEDRLVFQVSPHGKIRLIENDYSKKLAKYKRLYLNAGDGDEAEDNFPPFLASITLDLFKRAAVSNNVTLSEDMEITIKPR